MLVQTMPENFDALRNRISSEERDILNVVYKFWIENNEWIPKNILHHKIRNPKLDEMIKGLNGSIIFESWDNNEKRYELTLLGAYISDYQSEIEDTLVKYVKFIHDIYDVEPAVKQIKSRAIQKKYNLTDEQIICMGRLIRLSYFLNGGFGGDLEWESCMPDNVHEFLYITNFEDYIKTKVFSTYKKNEPVSYQDRLASFHAEDAASKKHFFSKLRGDIGADGSIGLTEINGGQADLIKYVTDDSFKKGHIDEINKAYKYGCYTCVFVLLRKIIENLIIDILKHRFPPTNKDNKELYFDVNQGRNKDFGMILKNLYSKRKEFDHEEKLVEKIYNTSLRLKDESNDKVHYWFHLVQDPKEVDNLSPQGLIDMITTLEKHIGM